VISRKYQKNKKFLNSVNPGIQKTETRRGILDDLDINLPAVGPQKIFVQDKNIFDIFNFNLEKMKDKIPSSQELINFNDKCSFPNFFF